MSSFLCMTGPPSFTQFGWPDDGSSVPVRRLLIRDDDLRRRQQEHMDKVRRRIFSNSEQACMHDQCSQCVGTGVKSDGTLCVHMISCPCPRCRPRCF